MKKRLDAWGDWLIGFSVFLVYAVILQWTEANASWETLFGYEKLAAPWHSIGFALLMFGLFGFLFAFILFMGRKKYARETQEKEKFKEMFMHLPVGLLIISKETSVILESNPKASSIYSLPLEEIVGKRIGDVFGELEMENGLKRHVSPNGESSVVKLSTFDTLWGTKPSTVMLVEDVTQLYEQELETRRLAHAIHQTEDAVFMTTRDGFISYVNPSYERLTGRRAVDVLGKDYRLLKPVSVSDEDFDEYGDRLLQGEELRVPFDLRAPDGSVRHVISVTTPVKNSLGQIEAFVTTDRDVTEERRAAERFKLLAETDELTGMLKRSKFLELLQSELGGDSYLYFCDLDGFKEVNDVLGHGLGDKLLVKVSQRLASLTGGSDRVCRLGGDEFLLLPKADGRTIRQFGISVLDAFAHPVPVDDYELSVSISIGAVPMNASTDPDTLMQLADMSMYRAKQLGKNRLSTYTEEMKGQMSRRLMLEQELKQAIKSGYLMLVYQPQYNLLTRRLSGVEALLRWKHPIHGMISPLEFIPVAERSKLIVDLGLWSFREACRQMRDWMDKGIAPPSMSVNLSVMHIIQENVPEALLAIMDEENVAPELMCLEITESLMLSPKDTTLKTLEDFKLLGMSIALDDFGTGYSSLSYLKEFPIDKIKIDKNFVQGISDGVHDAAIVKSVIQMSKSMGLKVIAEGVETSEQLSFLVSSDCDEIQGYISGKPMSPEDFSKWVAEGKDQLSESSFI